MAYLVLNNSHSFTHSLIIYYKSKHLSVAHLNVTFFCYKLLINYMKVILITPCHEKELELTNICCDMQLIT